MALPRQWTGPRQSHSLSPERGDLQEHFQLGPSLGSARSEAPELPPPASGRTPTSTMALGSFPALTHGHDLPTQLALTQPPPPHITIPVPVPPTSPAGAA